MNTSYDPSMYSMMTQEQRILAGPDMYISSIEKIQREERIYDFESSKFLFVNIETPPGMERLFLEILSNSGDNVGRSRLRGVDPGYIIVSMDRHTICITNFGIPIPIDIHPEHGIYVPEMIFGHLNSSGNYSGDRTGAGLNGLGAKLTNVFSSEFELDIVDLSRGLKYNQKWSKNMSIRNDPLIQIIQHGDLPEGQYGMVRVKYTLDIVRFGYDPSIGYSDETFKLFARHAIDTSITCKVPVVFNGMTFDMSDFNSYVEMLYPENSKFYHYEWPSEVTPEFIVTSKSGSQVCTDKRFTPIIELCVIDTPDAGTSISFVNGLLTQEGGSHVDSVYKAVGSTILEALNKDKKLLNIGDVKSHLTVVILCRVINPTFSSQSKTRLVKPASIKINIPEKLTKVISKWDFMKRLYFALEAKQFRQLQKTDGKRKKHVDILKLEDANNAGDPNLSSSCVLYVIEGESAKPFATTMVSFLQGRDFMGVLPIQGKILNVRNASALQMANNAEITILKTALGLREGVDYTLDDNFYQLRYGKLVICADSDSDGKHIIGLICNLFGCNYGSLIDRGFISFLRTTILKATHLGVELRFYTRGEYEKWLATREDSKKWHIDYFKGLGAIEDKDIRYELQDPKITHFVRDEKTDDTLDLVFNSKRAKERKEWILNWRDEYREIECPKVETITHFLNTEMIEHSIENIRRSIPGLDGLKEVQRKILHIMMKKYKTRKVKVAQLGGAVSEFSAYHHGEMCLDEAITFMAQSFAGTNNLPLLEDHGQFGTRNDGRSKHPSSRYLYTQLSWCVKYLFRKEDEPLFDFVVDEGEEREPKVMFPILPIHFINGSLGIGTGHSTFIPCFDPLHIYEWYRRKLLGMDLPTISPWYRGYNGEIKMNLKMKKNLPSVSFRTTGIFEAQPGVTIVRELPLFYWTHDYHIWLNSLVTEKKISSFTNHSPKDGVQFEIYGFNEPNVKTLQLSRSFSMMNMTILDENNLPIRYKSLHDALDNFYNWRIKAYIKRKEMQLEEILRLIKEMEEKIKFIEDINSEPPRLVVRNRKKSDVQADMTRLGHNIELLKSNISNLTTDDVLDLQQKIERKKSEFTTLKNKDVKEIWLVELGEWFNEYIKHYPM